MEKLLDSPAYLASAAFSQCFGIDRIAHVVAFLSTLPKASKEGIVMGEEEIGSADTCHLTTFIT